MLDLTTWEFTNDFIIPVEPHNLCGANKIRIILDSLGLAKHKETGEVVLGYSMLVETWLDNVKISQARTTESVADVHTADPQSEIVAVALALFPDTNGKPLQIASIQS